jgi:hypothetical protein
MLWAVASENKASTLFSEDFQTGRTLKSIRIVKILIIIIK